MGQVIAFANQKGGVTKTTTTHNIAVALSFLGKKVLMIDLDSQASLTISAGIEPEDIANNCIVTVLTDDKSKNKPIQECIHQTGNEGLYILPSIIDLADLEWKMFARTSREKILDRAIEPIKNDYEFILIDCPPQLSILTLNALACSDGVIIPIKTDYLAYRGIQNLVNTVSEVKEYLNPRIQILGVIATLYEKISRDDTDVLMTLNREYQVIGVINKKVMAKKGVYDGVAVVELAPEIDISIAYKEIAAMIVAGKYRKGVGAGE
jgi:chromosome partitioning protein